MNFLKSFFNDNSTIIGLCGFETIKPKYTSNRIKSDIFFNSVKTEKKFETNFSNNVLLF